AGQAWRGPGGPSSSFLATTLGRLGRCRRCGGGRRLRRGAWRGFRGGTRGGFRRRRSTRGRFGATRRSRGGGGDWGPHGTREALDALGRLQLRRSLVLHVGGGFDARLDAPG